MTPESRQQVVDDTVVDLRLLQDDIAAGVAVPAGGSETTVVPVVVETTRGIPWRLAGPIAVASALLAAFGVWVTIPSPPEPLVTRFQIDYPPETTFVGAWVDRNGQVEPLPFEPRDSRSLDLSPDGQSIALEIQGDDGDQDICIYEIER